MPRRLSYTEKALDDLDAARRWLTQPGSGQAATRKLAIVRSDIRQLKQNPCRWPVGVHPGVREQLCAGGYRVFYRVRPDTGSDATAGDVLVLRVYGPVHTSLWSTVLAVAFSSGGTARRLRG